MLVITYSKKIIKQCSAIKVSKEPLSIGGIVRKSAKATHIFSAKNRILYIESAKTVNEMTLNKLVKLTTL